MMIRIEQSQADTTLPLVFDSPHSGCDYPQDFRYAIDLPILRRSEDAFVDELFGAVTQRGGVMLHPSFPRCYIDPNRSLDDVDLELIDGDWPHPVVPSAKQARGAGLIWRQVKKYGDIYNRKLSPEEVTQRIDQCWRPYHQAIQVLLNEAYDRDGFFLHLNCHSMASMGDHTTEDGPTARPDFILGDQDGTTCAAILTDTVAQTLRDRGYQVVLNDPYKGQELVKRYSDPMQNKHSLQIEMNRALYLDETTIQKTRNFGKLKSDLDAVIDALAHLAIHMRDAKSG